MMTAAAAAAGDEKKQKNKKPRKPYAISRPREKWTADEHDRFLRALLVLGRDWKAIERFMGTKTATQIRSHAQKYFLKAHKLGLAALPPPAHPRRAAVLPQPPSVMNRPSAAAARWPHRDDGDDDDPLFMPATTTPNGGGAVPCGEAARCWFADRSSSSPTVQLPLSPDDDPRFAEVYRFVGDVFGSGSPRPVEAQLRRLHDGVDPLVVDTILLVLTNLQDNLCV